MPNFEHRTYGTNVATVTQLWQSYPDLKPYYPFAWENEFDGDYFAKSMWDNQHLVYLLVGVYICLVFMVKADKAKFCFVTKKVNPKTGKEERVTPGWLRHSFGMWNLGLSLFSHWGMARTVPQLLYYLNNWTLKEAICTPPTLSFGHGACGLWAQAFIVSKIPELFDTMFLALKGVNLDLLQWYHHSTVLAFCWHSYVNESAYGLWFIAMNYTVHAIMYMYFALMNYKLFTGFLKTVAPLLTFMQISQMVVGTFVVFKAIMLKREDPSCAIEDSNLVFGGIIYFSYLCLFVQFAINKYGPKPKGKTA